MLKNRNPVIDSLRGAMLLLIAAAHLPHAWSRWLWDLPGYASSAEGFIFLSGLVAGRAYSRAQARGADVGRRARGRAAQLYVCNLLLLLFLTGLVLTVQRSEQPLFEGSDLMAAHPLRSLLLGALFLNLPGLTDILPLYCVFLLLVPWILRAATAGRSAWVLAVGAVLWGLAQAGLTQHLLTLVQARLWIHPGFFDPLAWQLLFVVGVLLGERWSRADPVVVSAMGVYVAAGICIILFLVAHGWVGTAELAGRIEALARRDRLGPIRVLDFALLAVVFAAVARSRPGLLNWPWLAFLGRRPLPVFLVGGAAAHLVSAMHASSDPTYLAGVSALGSLWVAAWLHLVWHKLMGGKPRPA